jgi:hypothetical protein
VGYSLLYAAQFFSGDCRATFSVAEKLALEDNIDSVWQYPIMMGLFRRCCIMNDTEGITYWHKIMEENLSTKLDKRRIYQSLYEFPRCWIAIFRKDFKEALKQYHAFAVSFTELEQLNSCIVELLCQGPMFTWLLLAPWSPQYRKYGYKGPKLKDSDVQVMIEACTIMKNKTFHFGVKKQMKTVFWPYIMFEAALIYLTTRDLDKALKKLVHAMEDPKLAEDFAQLEMYYAMLHWIRGCYTLNEDARKKHCIIATERFKFMGADLMAKYVNGSPF